MVGSPNVTSSLSVGLGVKPEGSSLTLLTVSGKNAVAITGTTVKVTEAVLEANGKEQGKAGFEGCATKVKGVSEASCEPIKQPIALSETIETVKHEGATYAKATGVGGQFATVAFSASCLLIEGPIKITGTGWIADANNEFEVEESTHLIQEGTVPAAALGGLSFG